MPPISSIAHNTYSMIVTTTYSIITLLLILISSCSPAIEVPADRTRNVIDSITLDSLYREYLVVNPASLHFESEFPSSEITTTVEFINTSDSLFIPINAVELSNGAIGFKLMSDSISFILSPKGKVGSSRTISLTCKPTQEGIIQDTILINSWKNFFVPIRCNVLPGTRVWVEDLHFGDLIFGENRDTTIKVYNKGNRNVTVTGASFVSGEISQFQVLNNAMFPMVIYPGYYRSIPIRCISTLLGSSISADLLVNISYSGQGRVKQIAKVNAEIHLIPNVYVTDIHVNYAFKSMVYMASCSIVNNTDSPCYVKEFVNFKDTDSLTIIISGKNQGYWLSPKTAMNYIVKITPKYSGPFSTSFEFPITNANNPKNYCKITGVTF